MASRTVGSSDVARRIVTILFALAFAFSLRSTVARAQCPSSEGTYPASWTSGNGNWSSPAKWSVYGFSCAPRNSSPVYFNVQVYGSGSDTIILDTSATIDALVLGGGETLTDAGVAQTLTIGSNDMANLNNVYLNNTGVITLSASGSQLVLNGGAYSGVTFTENNNGTISLANGATLALSDGGGGDTFAISGNGAVNLSGGDVLGLTGDETLENYSTITGYGTIGNLASFVNAGTVNANSGYGVTVNAPFTNSSDVYVTGAGGMSVFAPFINNNLVQVTNGSPLSINGNYVNNSNTIVDTGSVSVKGNLTNNGNFSLTAPSALVVTGNLTNYSGLYLIYAGNSVDVSGTFSNFDDLELDTGSSLTTNRWGNLSADGSRGDLTGGAAYNLYGGTFFYTADSTGAAAVGILNNVNTNLYLENKGGLATDAIGSTVMISSDGGVTSALDNLNANGGAIELTGITQNLNGGLQNNGALYLYNGSAMTTNCAGSAGCSSPAAVGGDITGSGNIYLYNLHGSDYGNTLTVNGNLTQNQIVLDNAYHATGGGNTLNVTGNLTTNFLSLDNRGDTANVGGSYTNNSSLDVGNGAALNVTGNISNGSGASANFSGTGGQINVANGSAFNNGGTLVMTGSGDTVTAGTFNNAGSVTIGTGETIHTTAAGGYTQTAGTTQGTGTLDGNVSINGGTLVAGTTGTAGTLTITGNYTQTSGGVFDELISRTATGTLTVGGSVTLDSGAALDVSLLDGYDPANGTSFDIAAGNGTESGAFTISDPYFGSGNDQEWVVTSYDTDGDIVLTAEPTKVTPTPEPSVMRLMLAGLLAFVCLFAYASVPSGLHLIVEGGEYYGHK